MRYGKLIAASLLAMALWLPAFQGEAARYDDDEIVTVVEGEEALQQERVIDEKKSSDSQPYTDKSRADEWFEEPEELPKKEDSKKDNTKERYIRVADESGFVYYLDTQTAKWRYLPYSASEKILDVWVKLVHEGVGDYGSEEDYSYPQSYFMEHYYLRPERQQIQFLCELEVTGRPQNAIKERDYSPANWENLVPGSVEDDIYHGAIEVLKKRKGATMTRHGKNLTMRDALEEYLRISL